MTSSDQTYEFVNDLLVSVAEVSRCADRTHVSVCLCVDISRFYVSKGSGVPGY